jgi:hypothetical protein
MEKNLKIPYVSGSYSLDQISSKLDAIPKNPIDQTPWDNEADVTATFTIVYTESSIFLKFFVTEEHVSARYNQPNDAVYKDSCVEFFITLEGVTGYYNFEFNCKGNAHVGFGEHRENRELIPLPLLDQIQTAASFKTVHIANKAMIKWELTIAIPFASFWHHDIKSLKDQIAKVNFYKCGDELPQPHYLCWSPIQSAEPDFHLPEFFADAIFES